MAQCSEIAIAAHVMHTQGTQLSRKGLEEEALMQYRYVVQGVFEWSGCAQ